MHEADPLRAPKRDRSDRSGEARGDGAAVGLVVALGLCVLGAIFYVHQHPLGDGTGGAAMTEGGQMAEGGGAGGMHSGAPFMGTRKEMKEAPLEKAKPIARDVFAPPVAHVTESDSCKSLRLAKERIRENMRQPHSEVDSADLQRDMNVVMSQGTERGCWTGGAG